MREHMIYIARAGQIGLRRRLNEETIHYAERTGEGPEDEKKTPEKCATCQKSCKGEAGSGKKRQAIKSWFIRQR